MALTPTIAARGPGRVAAFLLAAWWATALSLAPGKAAAVTKTIAYKIDELPADFRLVGPRHLYEPAAEFTIWVPPAQAKKAFQLVVTRPGGESETRSVRLKKPKPKEKPVVWTGVVTVEMSEWPDGAYSAAVRGSKDRSGALPRARCEFQIVREKADKTWKGDLRDELAVWLEHANRPRDIWKKVPHWHNLDRVMREPGLLYGGLRGLVLRSYRNPQLERLQPYAVYVPRAYDPKRKTPLMILLHGSGGNYLNLVSDVYEGQELETNPMLVANAGAFKSQEYRHMALNDVLWVIEDMKKKYNVDADRVYLQGISLGGRGAMEMAALRPDVFAAVSPQGAYGCFQEPTDVPDYCWQSDWGRWSAARWDMRSYLPNLRNMPIQFIYGHRDRTTPPVNALTFKTLLNKRFGGKAEAVGFDADHNISFPVYKWSDTRAWFLKHRRAKNPSVVSARTASLRFNRFYWVTIDAMHVQWQMAEVEARYDRKAEALSVKTRNVARITLAPPGRYKQVKIDDQEIALPAGRKPKRLSLRRDAEGKWTVAAEAKPKAGAKRHGRSGPIWDIMHGRCLSVYGTRGTEEETTHLRKVAAFVARLDAAWGEPSLPVLADAEVSDDQKKTCNLFLVGDARTHALLAKGKWPFDLEAIGQGKGIRVFDQTYNEPGDVLCFIYPSPFAEEGYVYVVSPARPGCGAARALSPSTGWQIGEWSDWLVCRCGAKRGAAVGPYLVDGVFDADWRLERMPGRCLKPSFMNWEKE